MRGRGNWSIIIKSCFPFFHLRFVSSFCINWDFFFHHKPNIYGIIHLLLPSNICFCTWNILWRTNVFSCFSNVNILKRVGFWCNSTCHWTLTLINSRNGLIHNKTSSFVSRYKISLRPFCRSIISTDCVIWSCKHREGECIERCILRKEWFL